MRSFLIFILLFCGAVEAKIHVLVSILPQKYLVERIGRDEVEVHVIVPAGANAHSYEPTPKQVADLKKGELWFRIGENFEPRILGVLSHADVIDQRDGLDLIESTCGCCRDAHDPHIWLSPKLLKVQAKGIAEALIHRSPDHKEFFNKNMQALHTDLDKLNGECLDILSSTSQRVILVSHPAFGYFCRDYGLVQLSIEMEGREPTPRYLTDLIVKARLNGVRTVFLQQQHNPKGGIRIAEELGITTHYIDPYAENVIENIHCIATLFSKA